MVWIKWIAGGLAAIVMMLTFLGCTSRDSSSTPVSREISQSPPGTYGYYQDGDVEGVFFVVDSSSGGDADCDLPTLKSVAVVEGSVDATEMTWPQRGCSDRGPVMFEVALTDGLPLAGVQLTFQLEPEFRCENVVVVPAQQPQLCDEDSISQAYG